MPPLDLTDDERAELIRALRRIVDYDFKRLTFVCA
jgi:hypothetical protein